MSFAHWCLFLVGLGFAGNSFSYDEISKRRKERLLCRDVMAFVSLYPLPADPDINKIWNLALNLCLSKVALAARYRKMPVDHEERKHLMEAMNTLDPVIQATLYALHLSFFVFRTPFDLRKRLIDTYNKVKEREFSINALTD